MVQPAPRRAAPTGTVSLTGQSGYVAAGPVSLVNGRATVTVPWSRYLGTGNQQLLAQYSGDSNYAPNISLEVRTIVLPATPAITVSADAATVARGAVSTLTVDVRPTISDPELTLPYGNVRFYNSLNGGRPRPVGMAQSLQAGNGNFTTFVLTTTLPQGTNMITVQYLSSPNGQWGPVASAPVTVRVKPGQDGRPAYPASGPSDP
jgi:hypothetical protein